MVVSLPRWPEPLPDELIATHGAYAEDVLNQFIAAGALSADQVARLRAIIDELNRRLSEAFDEWIAPSIRVNRPVTEAHKLRFFEILTTSCEDADQQILALAPGVPDRVGFVALSQLDVHGAQKLMTFYSRFVEGTPEDERFQRSFSERDSEIRQSDDKDDGR
jgi:hypothetical protein